MILPTELAFLVLIVGILAVYWELLRPGLVLPGAVGLGTVLAAAYWLSLRSPRPAALALTLCSICLFACGFLVFARCAAVLGCLATATLALGVCGLFPAPSAIRPALAIPLSLLLGFVTVFLIQRARAARLYKTRDP